MRRITVEDVRAAYEKTGLKPVNRTFREWSLDGGGMPTGCCAICALGIVAGKFKADEPDIFQLVDWAAATYGDDYARAFRRGFDKIGPVATNDPQWAMGYEDGLAAAAAIFGEVPA